RDLAAKHVIFPSESTGFFHAQDIHGPFDQANQRSITARVRTNVTDGSFGQSAADFAKSDALACLKDSLGQMFNGTRFGLHQVQSKAFGGTRADAGQFAQFTNQGANLFRQDGQKKRRGGGEWWPK